MAVMVDTRSWIVSVPLVWVDPLELALWPNRVPKREDQRVPQEIALTLF